MLDTLSLTHLLPETLRHQHYVYHQFKGEETEPRRSQLSCSRSQDTEVGSGRRQSGSTVLAPVVINSHLPLPN